MAAELGLVNVWDLLSYLPRRYDERGQLTDVASLRPGESVTVQARVVQVSERRTRGRQSLPLTSMVVTDGQANLPVTFFRRRGVVRQAPPGATVVLAGKAEEFRQRVQLTNPEMIVLDGGPTGGAGAPTSDEFSSEMFAQFFAGQLVPVYPATKNLPSWKIGGCVRLLLDLGSSGDAPADDEDPLPADLRRRHRLPGLWKACELVHRPSTFADVARARTRFKWDEAFVLQIALGIRRRDNARFTATPRPSRPDGLRAAFDAALPFQLTAGQAEVGEAIATDMSFSYPMHRLLQGEVASGKTVVALRAMLTAVDAGGQAVLLAPTETLAGQHYRTLRDLLGPLGRAGELDAADVATRVTLVTGSLGGKARREALAEVADGRAGLVVGTHALLHEGVSFAELALVVVDEQHRFGVEQRDVLRSRGDRPPHLLVMTATPIPRTVAMTVFGDLEVSTLTELPAGRAPTTTAVVPASWPNWTERMWRRVRDEVAAGRQAYVVCPRITGDEADSLAGDTGAGGWVVDGDGDGEGQGQGEGDGVGVGGSGGSGADGGAGDPAEPIAASVSVSAARPVRRSAAALDEVLPKLCDGELAGLRLAGLHGRMPPDEREAVMGAFAAGEIDVLVATTVVEVGVNVPNASVMVVLDADRFGVSQLHQLRGRVGRGGAPGWCLLHTDVGSGTPAGERLTAVASTSDGAKLAMLDLEQRREGDVLGVAQSGARRSLRLLRLSTDEELITKAREEAALLLAADPLLTGEVALAQLVRQTLDRATIDYLDKG